MVLNFARWADFAFDAAALADPLVSGAGRDPDGDGFDNFFEYACGGDPMSAGSPRERPRLDLETLGDEEFLVIEFIRSGWSQPLVFRVEGCDDLASWAEVGAAQIDKAAPVARGDGTVGERWRFTEPVGTLRARFLRLAVEASGP
jgi:hypothetical protein